MPELTFEIDGEFSATTAAFRCKFDESLQAEVTYKIHWKVEDEVIIEDTVEAGATGEAFVDLIYASLGAQYIGRPVSFVLFY